MPTLSTNLTTWGTFIGGIATAITVCLLVWQTHILSVEVEQQQNQTKILQTQFKVKDRPWIGVDTMNINDNNQIHFGYTNYGAIPNDGGTIQFAHSEIKFTKDDLAKSSSNIMQLGALIPTQHQNFDVTETSDEMMQKANSGIPLYVGILISYNYSDNQSGEYGMITKYNNVTHHFALIDNWTK